MASIHGLILTRDLFFLSKVTGTASVLNIKIEAVANCEQLHDRVIESQPRVIFFDLNCPDTTPLAVMNALPDVLRPRVIAFGSHVDEATLLAASQAGCDEVMARSKFSMTLPDLLRRECTKLDPE